MGECEVSDLKKITFELVLILLTMESAKLLEKKSAKWVDSRVRKLVLILAYIHD